MEKVELRAILSTAPFGCGFCGQVVSPKSDKKDKQEVVWATITVERTGAVFILCSECWISSQQEKRVLLHPRAHLGKCGELGMAYRRMYGYDERE